MRASKLIRPPLGWAADRRSQLSRQSPQAKAASPVRPFSRCRRLLTAVAVAALMTTTSLFATLVTATPARAAQGCAGYFGPYWFAGADATRDAGRRKLLAVDSPWADGSRVYIWDNNNDLRQQWCLQSVPGGYRFRYAHNNSLCIGGVKANGAQMQLQSCTAGGVINFTQILEGEWRDPNGTIYPSYIFEPTTDPSLCLDVYNGNSANGTRVQLWTCNGRANQIWY